MTFEIFYNDFFFHFLAFGLALLLVIYKLIISLLKTELENRVNTITEAIKKDNKEEMEALIKEQEEKSDLRIQLLDNKLNSKLELLQKDIKHTKNNIKYIKGSLDNFTNIK